MFNSDAELQKATDRIFYSCLFGTTLGFALFGWFVFNV